MLADPIKNKDDLESIKRYFLEKDNVRDYTLFVLGINSMIKINDLISLRWGDVFDFEKKSFHPFLVLNDKRTEKQKEIALNDNCKNAILMLKEHNEQKISFEDYIFNSKKGGHITRIRAFQIIKEAAENLGIKGNITPRSLRKTSVYYSYKDDAPSNFFMNMYTKTDIDDTKKYFAFDLEEKFSFAMPNI